MLCGCNVADTEFRAEAFSRQLGRKNNHGSKRTDALALAGVSLDKDKDCPAVLQEAQVHMKAHHRGGCRVRAKGFQISPDLAPTRPCHVAKAFKPTRPRRATGTAAPSLQGRGAGGGTDRPGTLSQFSARGQAWGRARGDGQQAGQLGLSPGCVRPGRAAVPVTEEGGRTPAGRGRERAETGGAPQGCRQRSARPGPDPREEARPRSRSGRPGPSRLSQLSPFQTPIYREPDHPPRTGPPGKVQLPSHSSLWDLSAGRC